MLVAKDSIGNKVIAEKAEKKELHTCPGCAHSVILKRGKIKIAHFSHAPDSQCAYGAGESELHMNTKLSIYNYLLNHGAKNVEMEKFLGDNRPDVYFEKDDNKIAIEVQISNLTFEEIQRRTLLYLEKNIHVLWISPIEEFKVHKDSGEFSIKSWQEYLYWLYFENLYFWSPQGVEILYLRPVERWIEETEWGGGYYKTLKKRKTPMFSQNKYDIISDFKAKTRAEKFSGVETAKIYMLHNW